MEMNHPRSELVTLRKTRCFSAWGIVNLFEAAQLCLSSFNVEEKARLTLLYCHAWNEGIIANVFPHEKDLTCIRFPEKPSRPLSAYVDEKQKGELEGLKSNPRLCTPLLSDALRSKVKNLMKKNAIEYTVHGIANAESYAIDLFWDLIGRFHRDTSLLPKEFFDDMVYIVQQESHHFTSWRNRLLEMGFTFGSFPFQDGLWQSASDTSGDILARLSVINLIHEAKGLDTYLKTKDKFLSVADHKSLDILENNYQEEIGHVRFGLKWFIYICNTRGVVPIEEFHRISRLYFKGKLKEPFNRLARTSAGMTEEWYIPLT